MAIEILTGVPGAGKTYYAVHKIKKLLSSDDRLLVLHNIEGLSLQDNRCIAINWTAAEFNSDFMKERVKSLRSEYNLKDSDLIHIYVDEAQRFFPPELKDPAVLYFFDYHRHFGVNVTLITQHEKKLTFKITSLAEVEIRAVSSRINPFGSFVYKLSSGGEHYATERLSRDRAIFALYKSFQAGTGTVKKSKFRHVVFVIVVLAVVAWLVFFKFFAKSFGLGDKETVRDLPKPPVASKPSLPFSAPAPVAQQTYPQKGSAPAVPKTEYMGPEILEYNAIQDMVFVSDSGSDFKGYISVSRFLEKYPPQLYGYGYFHVAKKRFVLLSASNQEFIYPVKNPVFMRPQVYVRFEPDKTAPAEIPSSTSDLPNYPLEYADKTMMPDSQGYTRADYERVFMYQRGLKYTQPEFPSSASAMGGENASLQ